MFNYYEQAERDDIFTMLVWLLCRGESLDKILRSENEKLTEDRDALQQNIKQLELKIAALESATELAPAPVCTNSLY